MSQATEFNGYIHLNGADYRLSGPIVWELGLKGSGHFITIPAGFVFQSSVPAYARWIVSQHHEPWLLAAAVHDWLLVIGYNRAAANAEWFQAARATASRDSKARLVLPAYHGMNLLTLK